MIGCVGVSRLIVVCDRSSDSRSVICFLRGSVHSCASAERCTVVSEDPFWQADRPTHWTLLEWWPERIVAHRCGHPSRWVAWLRSVVSTSIPQAGHWTYVYPVGSPYASTSRMGPSQSISVGGCAGETAVVVPVDSTPAGSLVDMLPRGSAVGRVPARSGQPLTGIPRFSSSFVRS